VSRRQQWRDAVQAAAFAVGLRPVKATLLSLPISVDGKLTAWRDEIAEATGLPLRTVGRHLARACEAGWLVHAVRGRHGRRSTYAVQIPDIVVGHLWRTTTPSCRPRSTDNSPRVVGHVVAHSIKDTASASELVAVDNHRERQTEHGGTRDEAARDETQLRSDEEAPARPRLVAASPEPAPNAPTLDDATARGSKTASSASADPDYPCGGNPCCTICGLARLYSPATIARGICASCVALLDTEAMTEPTTGETA
jgi:hypothetical protein